MYNFIVFYINILHLTLYKIYNMKITIERQIKNPVTEKTRKRIYPFHELKVGDAFHIDQNLNDKIEFRRVYINVVNSSRNFERKVQGVKFFVYKSDQGISCYRKS